MGYEDQEAKEKISASKPKVTSGINLQEAIKMGEYDPEVFSNLSRVA